MPPRSVCTAPRGPAPRLGALHRGAAADGLFQSEYGSFDLNWDGADNLRQAYQQGTLWMQATYNGDGLRVTKQDFWSPSHHDTWGLGGVLLDTNDSQPSGAANNALAYTPGISANVNGVDQFFHTDWLGSTRYLSDRTGNAFPSALRYDAFGEQSRAKIRAMFWASSLPRWWVPSRGRLRSWRASAMPTSRDKLSVTASQVLTLRCRRPKGYSTPEERH